MLRHADPGRDGAACAAIYAPFVDHTGVSFEETAPDAVEMASRIATISPSYPWLVAEREQRVVGFAYASEHRGRSAYRWAADVTVYVDPGSQRQRLGRSLYEGLFELLRRQRLHTACAGITLPNDASVGLHRALGFTPVGVYHRIGWKAGAWHDVSWWELALAPPNGAPPSEPRGAPPPEPLGPQRLA